MAKVVCGSAAKEALTEAPTNRMTAASLKEISDNKETLLLILTFLVTVNWRQVLMVVLWRSLPNEAGSVNDN
jgi:hypothetical protein